MRNSIAIIMALLGTVLILSGAAALWAAALARPRAADEPTVGTGPLGGGPLGGGTRADRTLDRLSRVPSPDRLIAWGVVLLALSAVAAGAVSFSATATAGTS